MNDGSLSATPRIIPAGDLALVVELGDGIDERVNRRVHGLAHALGRRAIDGVVDLIPTYRSLLVNYDPLRITAAVLADTIGQVTGTLDDSALPSPKRVEIPTCYGGQFGPDLPFVASHNGLTEQDVVAIHTANPCRVFMMGFSPGFTYMGGMSPRIATPRLKTPRTAIPAGSVGIAQQQTGIYPVESPGGWQLIGRTPLRMFDPDLTPPTLLEPGDVAQFVAIDEARFREMSARASSGARGSTSSPRPEHVEGRRPESGVDVGHRTPDTGHVIIEVLEPGALTTVQDLGRYGFQRYGVPVSGAMDTFALRVANLLVGNDEGAAGLEMTIAGAQTRLLDDAVIAITGGDMQPRIDGQAVPMWEAVAVGRGAMLSFRGLRSGARAYLAIAGGIDVPVVLGSRSTYLRSCIGGQNGRPLRPGDRLMRGPVDATRRTRRLPPSWSPAYLGSHRLRVVLGPQDAAFTARGIQTLLSSAYTISAQSDRMGYRLEGPRIEHRTVADIISDGTPAGAVQVAGDGLPLLLVADRGTTGGYAKIATIISVDLPRVAQSQPGDRLFFDQVSVAEAHDALARERALFEGMRT